jgi:hypothetical protein
MPRLRLVAALAICILTTLLLGRRFGYSDITSFLAFWLAAALTAASARRLARCAGGTGRPDDVVVRGAVIAIAIIVGCTMILGAIGRLAVAELLALHLLTFVAVLWITRSGSAGREPTRPDRLPPVAVAIGTTTIVFAVAYGLWYAPLTLYDSLSYHLHFAARWVQDHAVTILPTPFSDEAQAYAPANGELVLAWLMLPFHGDLLARIGQLPFALLGAVSVYAIARRLDTPPAHAVYPALFFLLARPTVEQMIGANVDLVCATCFLATVYLVIVAADRDDARDWALAGVSAGLYLGSKYVALVYAPVLVLLACARGIHRESWFAIPGIALFGLPWYVRNWIVAGSPIYPGTLTVAGVAIARGAFTRAAMLHTVFHTSDPRLFPAMAAHALGPALFAVWLPCALAGWIRMARRGWWPHGALVSLPLLMALLYWYGFPVNVDPRFLMPAVGLALLPFAFVFTGRPGWNACVHVGFAAAAAWAIVGSSGSLPGSVPWFMGGWLALDGLVSPPFLPSFAAIAVLMAAVWLLLRRSPPLALPVLVSVSACVVLVLTLDANHWCGNAGCQYLRTTSPFIRAGYTDSWHWIDDNISGATIAYTGINLPYPLTGRQLANRVVYVNIDGRQRWRFHDYDRAYRLGRWSPPASALAVSSGELMPIATRSGPREDAVRPRYERMDGNRDAWIGNLERLRVQYVFVARLSAYEIDYVWHNERGFPIEDEWATSDPVRFRPVYRNPQVHIYSLGADARVRG